MTVYIADIELEREQRITVTAIRTGKTGSQAGAATEQAPLPMTMRATRPSTKERRLRGRAKSSSSTPTRLYRTWI